VNTSPRQRSAYEIPDWNLAVYPPTMLILVAPIARLTYTAAFFAWIGATLCLYAVAPYAILPELLKIVLTLLPLPVVNNVFAGQMAFLTAGLLGLLLAFTSRRPYLCVATGDEK
jgi:Glycosyltransferase family 87